MLRSCPVLLLRRALLGRAGFARVNRLGLGRLLLRDRQMPLPVPMLREIEVQPNGQLTNSLAVFTDEYWGFEKMGEFLPVNYLPPSPKPGP